MNIVVCILVFLYINYLGVRYITTNRSFEKKSLWNQQESVSFSGNEMFVLLTLSCAIVAAAPLGLLPIRLFLWIILLLGGLLKCKDRYFGVCVWIYALYLCLILSSLFWSPAPFYGFRVFLKYLLPFLILLVFPDMMQNKEIFPYGCKALCCVLKIYYITYFLSVIGMGFITRNVIGGVWWWGPAICDSFSVFLPLTVVTAKLFSDKRFLLLIFAMTLSPLIGHIVRTGLVALFVSAVAMAVFRYKYKAAPFILALIVIAFAALIYIPQLRYKMFYDPYATEEYIKDYENWSWDAVDSNGRFAMWDACLQLFFYPKPWFAAGAGAEQAYMYSIMDAGMGAGICHCDYVQILCDNGLIGIFLYGAAIVTLIIHSFFLYNDKRKHIYCRYSAFIAGTGMCGMAAAMMTDNVVNYTMCTLVFPFTFYAMALGLRKFSPDNEDESTNVQRNHTTV